VAPHGDDLGAERDAKTRIAFRYRDGGPQSGATAAYHDHVCLNCLHLLPAQ
jgi:hypothetical protein